jgi:hypothetical protein
MNDKLKKIIFDKLYMNLSDAEVIECNGSTFIIDREEKYWYIECENSGKLWWRYDFFEDFFLLFSIGKSEYKPIITEWVEEVLNCKVIASREFSFTDYEGEEAMEDILNCNEK